MSLCNLALLGSTGSIGKSALAVARALPDRIRVSLLAAGKNWKRRMRVLLQRVRRASVTVAGETVGEIGHGILLFIGITAGDALVVSQFTLYADCRKGRRPGFDMAGDPAAANELYEYFTERLKSEGVARVATGRFGADMLVSLENDGPATFLLSHPWEYSVTSNPEAEE